MRPFFPEIIGSRPGRPVLAPRSLDPTTRPTVLQFRGPWSRIRVLGLALLETTTGPVGTLTFPDGTVFLTFHTDLAHYAPLRFTAWNWDIETHRTTLYADDLLVPLTPRALDGLITPDFLPSFTRPVWAIPGDRWYVTTDLSTLPIAHHLADLGLVVRSYRTADAALTYFRLTTTHVRALTHAFNRRGLALRQALHPPISPPDFTSDLTTGDLTTG